MSDIQYKPKQIHNYKIDENHYETSKYSANWPVGFVKLFNDKFKAWEIRRGFATPETQGKGFKQTNNSFFKSRKKS